MGLSKKYLTTHSGVVTFDLCRLAARFEKDLPSASICLLMGSAAASGCRFFALRH